MPKNNVNDLITDQEITFARLILSGKMTDRQFHDGVLKLNSIPVEMIRASLLGQKPAKDFQPGWKFYDEVPIGKHLAGKTAAAQSAQ